MVAAPSDLRKTAPTLAPVKQSLAASSASFTAAALAALGVPSAYRPAMPSAAACPTTYALAAIAMALRALTTNLYAAAKLMQPLIVLRVGAPAAALFNGRSLSIVRVLNPVITLLGSIVASSSGSSCSSIGSSMWGRSFRGRPVILAATASVYHAVGFCAPPLASASRLCATCTLS